MTPLIQTNWQLFAKEKLGNFNHMESWILEDTSLIGRLTEKHGSIKLELISEKICLHCDQQISSKEISGNLRKIFLKANSNVVYAESFFSEGVISQFNKFRALGNEALGKYLFSHKNINKVETYVATYQLENKEYVARKCIYSLNEELFSVIEVFLFDE